MVIITDILIAIAGIILSGYAANNESLYGIKGVNVNQGAYGVAAVNKYYFIDIITKKKNYKILINLKAFGFMAGILYIVSFNIFILFIYYN
jgi:hypothetical protein